MKTATRRQEPATVASSPATPAQRLQGHEGLMAAKEKLNRLDSERATVQAKLDQARAAMHDSENIASKILAGEPLTIADSVNTEAETAKLKGYDLAIVRQKQAIQQELRSASRDVCDLEAPGHKAISRTGGLSEPDDSDVRRNGTPCCRDEERRRHY